MLTAAAAHRTMSVSAMLHALPTCRRSWAADEMFVSATMINVRGHDGLCSAVSGAPRAFIYAWPQLMPLPATTHGQSCAPYQSSGLFMLLVRPAGAGAGGSGRSLS